jgi:tRNA pseudouridine38-40 synthase
MSPATGSEKMARNFKLTIEYDGSGYLGWQRQKDPNTIQGAIERALESLTGNHVTLSGSGRTDSGVHALGQVANFHSDTHLPPGDIHRALNALLSDDIVILSCEEMPEAFHARFDVTSKCYRYSILNRPLPAALGRQYSWHIRKSLDIDAMQASLVHLRGTHNFKAFEGAGSPRADSIRQVYMARLAQRDNGRIDFEIEGNGFLRHMVRNIVGTLVDIGFGKITPDDLAVIRDGKDRGKAGITAPAHGLFLVRVNYNKSGISYKEQ